MMSCWFSCTNGVSFGCFGFIFLVYTYVHQSKHGAVVGLSSYDIVTFEYHGYSGMYIIFLSYVSLLLYRSIGASNNHLAM